MQAFVGLPFVISSAHEFMLEAADARQRGLQWTVNFFSEKFNVVCLGLDSNSKRAECQIVLI